MTYGCLSSSDDSGDSNIDDTDSTGITEEVDIYLDASNNIITKSEYDRTSRRIPYQQEYNIGWPSSALMFEVDSNYIFISMASPDGFYPGNKILIRKNLCSGVNIAHSASSSL